MRLKSNDVIRSMSNDVMSPASSDVRSLYAAHDDHFRKAVRCSLAACCIFFGGCATYQVGNQTLYRGDIRTIHVPIFESESQRRFLGQQLTEAVIKQIERDTPLVIADAAAADSFLQGRLVRDIKRPGGLDRFGEPRVLQSDWVVEVRWVDRSGVPLMQRQLVRVNESVEFIPEGGQSLSTAHRELIEDIARQVVGQMETPW